MSSSQKGKIYKKISNSRNGSKLVRAILKDNSDLLNVILDNQELGIIIRVGSYNLISKSYKFYSK